MEQAELQNERRSVESVGEMIFKKFEMWPACDFAKNVVILPLCNFSFCVTQKLKLHKGKMCLVLVSVANGTVMLA